MAMVGISENVHMKFILLLICGTVTIGFIFMHESIVGAKPANQAIMDWVYVESVNLGGMTKDEAEEVLYKYVDQVVMQPIILTLGDEAWQLHPADLNIHVFVPETVEKALAVGRTGSWLERLRFRGAPQEKAINIPLAVSVDGGLFRDFIFNLMTEIYIHPEDAAFIINQDDTVTIKPSITGRRLDLQDFGSRIRRLLTRGSDRTLVLTVEPIIPRFTTRQAEDMGIKECISKFATSFDSGNKPRVHNIKEAASAIDRTILGPGETFSFNKVVGPRSAETGYLEAPIMIDDDLVPGIGGGICQVSSTLYNAALLANLTIVARGNHSMVPAYIAAGRDATVAYDYIDLKFRNDGENYILIKFFVTESTVTSKIYGCIPDAPNRKVSVVTVINEKIPPGIIEKEDPLLAPGDKIVEDEGAWGYIVTVYRVVEHEGIEQSRERISRDRYRPRPKRIRVGTGLS
ncbi:MAG: hypothetical protein GX969_06030 [Firmicutes bacterium]|nr:hypothetical protein [Bacillota bacterium]